MLGGLIPTVHTHSENHTVETRAVPYVKTVHEHRAPTDESIKIYDEMLKKAKEAHVGGIKTSTPIEMNIEIFRRPHLRGYEAHFFAKINGDEFQDFVEIQEPMFEEWGYKQVEDLIREIYTKVLSKVVENALIKTEWLMTQGWRR